MARKRSHVFNHRQEFDVLKDYLCTQPMRPDVAWEYRLGAMVQALCPKEKRQYGEGHIDTLAHELGGDKNLANKLWLARNLNVAYGRKEITQLIKAAAASGIHLGINHAIALARLKDKQQREQVTERCITEGWSVRRLRREVQQLLGGKKSGGGIDLVPLKSSEDALHDLLARTNDWLNRYKKLWFLAPKAKLASPFSKKTAARLATQLQEAEDALSELRDAADFARQSLRDHRDQATATRRKNSSARKRTN